MPPTATKPTPITLHLLDPTGAKTSMGDGLRLEDHDGTIFVFYRMEVIGRLADDAKRILGDVELYAACVADIEGWDRDVDPVRRGTATAVRITPFETRSCGCVVNLGAYPVRRCFEHTEPGPDVCDHGERVRNNCRSCMGQAAAAGADLAQDRLLAEGSW